jgi:hypothetical protein
LLADREGDPARGLIPRIAGEAGRLTRAQADAIRRLLRGASR